MESEGAETEAKTVDSGVRTSRTSNPGRHRGNTTEKHKIIALKRYDSKPELFNQEDFNEDMLKATGSSFCSLQALGAFFTLEWLHFGDARTADRKGTFLFEHSNLSLISALLFTVAAAGFLVSHDLEHPNTMLHQMFAFFWCFSTFSSLMGACISLIYLLGANEINTALQFEMFEADMDLWLRVPFALALAGFFFMYIGLVIYLIIIYNEEMYICCIIICMSFIFIGFASMFQMTWALKRVFFAETWFVKKGLADTRATVEESEEEIQEFLKGIKFHTTDKATVARELTHQGIDLALLKTMTREDFYQLKNIALGEVLRIIAHASAKTAPTELTNAEQDLAEEPEEDQDPETNQRKWWR